MCFCSVCTSSVCLKWVGAFFSCGRAAVAGGSGVPPASDFPLLAGTTPPTLVPPATEIDARVTAQYKSTEKEGLLGTPRSGNYTVALKQLTPELTTSAPEVVQCTRPAPSSKLVRYPRNHYHRSTIGLRRQRVHHGSG